MDTESKTYVFGNDGNNRDSLGGSLGGLGAGMLGGALASGLGFGGFGGFGGWGGLGGLNYGMNGIADLFGLAIIASMFGWNGNGGFGNGGFGGNSGAAFLANQLSNDSGRELIMNAVTSQGEASRAAVQNLATMIGQDFNLVNSGVQNVQNALNTMAIQNATTPLHIINQLQNGNAQLSQEFCKCCCQTQQQIMAQGYENQIRTIEQTGTLSNQADRNTASIQSTLAAMQTNITREFCEIREREMQSKIDTQSDIITQLRGQLDNDRQTAQLYSVISPLQAKVNEIAAKQPNTVPIQYPNLVAVSNTPNVGNWGWNGNFGGGFFGNGFGNLVF